MSEVQAKQERMAAVVMSLGSIFIAAMEFLDRPAPGEFVEARLKPLVEPFRGVVGYRAPRRLVPELVVVP